MRIKKSYIFVIAVAAIILAVSFAVFQPVEIYSSGLEKAELVGYTLSTHTWTNSGDTVNIKPINVRNVGNGMGTLYARVLDMERNLPITEWFPTSNPVFPNEIRIIAKVITLKLPYSAGAGKDFKGRLQVGVLPYYTTNFRVDASLDFTITWVAPNKPPVCTGVTGPSTGNVGVPYTFTASGYDPDGDSIKHKFDWGDGTYTGYLISSSTSKNWKSAGTYSVKARVMDSKGAESFWCSPITITISSTATVTCWKCVGNVPTSQSFPAGTVCGSGVAADFPSSSQPDCGGAVTCWKCSGTTPISQSFPSGTICGVGDAINFPYSTTPNCGDPGEGFSITIIVTEKTTGDGISNATVGFGDKTAVTDTKGVAIFDGITPGSYVLKAAKEGYKSVETVYTATSVATRYVDLEKVATPGFELLSLIVALGIAFIILKKKKGGQLM